MMIVRAIVRPSFCQLLNAHPKIVQGEENDFVFFVYVRILLLL